MKLHVPPFLRMRLRGTALARVYARLHAALYVLTAGRLGGAIRVARGARPPVLLLTTTGRRSGEPRTTPLIYLSADSGDLSAGDLSAGAGDLNAGSGGGYVVVAANAGHPQDPAWWLNLVADPLATVQIGSARSPVVACEVEGPARDALWRRLALMYDGLDTYQRQSRRRFPVVRLTPHEATSG